jgi:hypothetical protein
MRTMNFGLKTEKIDNGKHGGTGRRLAIESWAACSAGDPKAKALGACAKVPQGLLVSSEGRCAQAWTYEQQLRFR